MPNITYIPQNIAPRSLQENELYANTSPKETQRYYDTEQFII